MSLRAGIYKGTWTTNSNAISRTISISGFTDIHENMQRSQRARAAGNSGGNYSDRAGDAVPAGSHGNSGHGAVVEVLAADHRGGRAGEIFQRAQPGGRRNHDRDRRAAATEPVGLYAVELGTPCGR